MNNVYYKNSDDILIICPVNSEGEHFIPEETTYTEPNKSQSIQLMHKLTTLVDQYFASTQGQPQNITEAIAQNYAYHLKLLLEIEEWNIRKLN